MNDLLVQQQQLQTQAKELLRNTAVLEFLGKLGNPIQTGSSVTGLMVYTDIDFSIQNDTYDIQDAITLTDALFAHLKVTSLKIADFGQGGEQAGYYIGFEIPFNNKSWHIDATVSRVGPIITNPPELQEWIEKMSVEQQITILDLKKQLLNSKRYVGASSQPPYTFRSAHLYEGVLKGGAKSVNDLEQYFNSKIR